VPKFGSHFKFGSAKFSSIAAGFASSSNQFLDGKTGYSPPQNSVVVTNEGLSIRVAKISTARLNEILQQGGILYGGQVATRALKDALEGKLISYEIKFYIQDNAQKWVDFSDRTNVNGRNSLMKIGSLSYTAERLRGQLQHSMSSIVLDNSDSFFDKPFPSSLMAEMDADFSPITPTAASFTDSRNKNVTDIFRHKCCVRISYRLTGDVVANILTLGVFLIEDLGADYRSKNVTVKLSALTQPLIDTSAEPIKRDTWWYKDVTAEYLVKRILEHVYIEKTNSIPAAVPKLPSTWEIDSVNNLRVPLDGSKAWAVSEFGRPTEKLLTSSGKTQYLFPKSRATALKEWSYSTGTITLDPESDIITGSGTSWSTTVSGNMLNAIKVGDSFIISPSYYTGDNKSTKSNDGYYTVTEVISATSIRIDRPPEGTESESSLKYSIARLYVGLGGVLYEYDIARDQYKQLLDISSSISGVIRKIETNNFATYPVTLSVIEEPQIDYNTWKTTALTLSTGDGFANSEKFNSTRQHKTTFVNVTWDANWSHSGATGTGTIYFYDEEIGDVSGSSYNGDPLPTYTTRSADSEATTRMYMDRGEQRRQINDYTSESAKSDAFIGNEDLGIFVPFKQPIVNTAGVSDTGPSDQRPSPMKYFLKDGDAYFDLPNTGGLDYTTSGTADDTEAKLQLKDGEKGAAVFFNSTGTHSNESVYQNPALLEEGVYDVARYSENNSNSNTAAHDIYGGLTLLKYSLGGQGAFNRIKTNYSVSSGSNSGNKYEFYFCTGLGAWSDFKHYMLGESISKSSSSPVRRARHPPYASHSKWYIVSLTDPADGSQTWKAYDFTRLSKTSGSGIDYTTYEDYTPVCSHMSSNGKIYLGLVRWGSEGELDSGNLNNRSATWKYCWKVIEITMTLHATEDRSLDTYDIKQIYSQEVANGNYQNAKVPYEITTATITNSGINGGSGTHVFVSCWNLSRVGAAKSTAKATLTSKHEILRFDFNGTDAATAKSIETADDFMQGLTIMSLGSANTDRKCVYWDSGRRIMKGADAYASTTFVSSQLTQIAENTVDQFQFLPPVFFENAQELYWIGSDVPHSLSLAHGKGNYNLTKWAPRAAVRIQMADFTGMSCWDALGHLAELSGCRYGFKPDGTFFFKRKPRHQNSEYTFTNNGTSGLISNSSKSYGYSMISNSISKTPSKLSIPEVKVSVNLTADSPYGVEDEDNTSLSTNHEIIGQSGSNSRATVTLRCIKGGKIKDSSSDSHADHAIFTYRMAKQFIETVFLNNYTTSSYAINVKDMNELYIGTEISAVGNSQTQLNDPDDMDTAIDRYQQVGMQLKMTDPLVISGDSTKHQDRLIIKKTTGVADLSNTLDNLGTALQRGTVLCIRNESLALETIEYVSVESIDTSSTANDTITVTRGLYADYPAIELKNNATIYAIYEGNTVYLNGALSSSSDDVFAINDQIRLEVPSQRDSTEFKDSLFNLNNATAPSSTVSEFIPFLNAWSWIGGKSGLYSTGLAVQFNSTSTENGFANHSFAKNDRIVVECSGENLETDGASVQVARNTRSIANFGERRSNSSQQNKFFNVNQAYWSALRDLDEFAFPKFTFTIDTIYTPWIEFDSIVSIESENALPRSKGFKTNAYITKMTFDPQARAMVRLTLRSVDPI